MKQLPRHCLQRRHAPTYNWAYTFTRHRGLQCRRV